MWAVHWEESLRIADRDVHQKEEGFLLHQGSMALQIDRYSLFSCRYEDYSGDSWKTFKRSLIPSLIFEYVT